MSETIRLLGVSGSLRKKSFNTMALRTAQTLLPEGVSMEHADISDLPLFDQDILDDAMPASVARFRAQCAAADAVLWVTPEYNYSLPGALKNAIDWASRSPTPPLAGKACAIMGASTGMLGTARAQYHLRQVLVFLDMKPVNKPEVFITHAASKFSDDGVLGDDKTREAIRALVVSLRDWTLLLRGPLRGEGRA